MLTLIRLTHKGEDDYLLEYFCEDLWTSEQETLGTISMTKVHDHSGEYMYTDVDYIEVLGMIYYKDQSPETDEETRYIED